MDMLELSVSPPVLGVTLDGVWQPLGSLAAFRAAQGLPEDFGMAFFEPEGLVYHGVWREVAVLERVRERLSTAVPHRLTLAQLPQMPQTLAQLFQNELIIQGSDFALMLDDVQQVATDLQNFLEPAAYKLVELYYQQGHAPTAVGKLFDMGAIYQAVLDSTVQLDTAVSYQHHHESWDIHLIYTIYGPIGLQIQTPTTRYYLQDRTRAFPALDFLATTSILLGQALCTSFTAT